MQFKLPKFDKVNVSQKDRVIRVIVAALLLIGFYNGGFHNWILALIALVLIATAYFRYCPVYQIANFDSNKLQPPADS